MAFGLVGSNPTLPTIGGLAHVGRAFVLHTRGPYHGMEESQMNKKIRTYYLAIKFWAGGVPWKDAVDYAKILVDGWMKF